MKRRLVMLTVFALLLALVVIPAAAQGSINPGTGTTYTELANTTADPAHVTITYYDQSGGSVAGPSPTIPGNGSTAIDPNTTGLPQGFNGAAVVSSDKQLASVVQTDWNGGPGDGYQMGLYTGVSAGSSTICFPSLWKNAGSIESSFSVQNTHTAAVNVSITWVGRDGVPQGTFNDTIPVGAQHTYDLMTPGGAVPNLPPGWAGSAKVSVSGAGSVAGVAVVNYGSGDPKRVRSTTYNAADCAGLSGSTTLEAPSHFRLTQGGTSSGKWLIWSFLNIQNLEGDTAHVQVTYTPRSGGTPVTLNKTIAPNSTIGMNTRTGGDFPASDFDPLGYSFDGTVEIVSDNAVVAIVGTQWDRNAYVEAGMYAAFNKNAGATTYWVPNMKRLAPGGTWRAWSAAIVQNLGSANADVTLTFYDRNGNAVLTLANQTIAPLAAIGYNTKTGGSLPANTFDPLGTSYEGHVKVVSNNGQPLGVVLNGISRPSSSPFQSASGTTNGVSQ
ncbi:MAG: hypothetical protein D6791_15830 [Chloroflexi bacterium]|nr:MAG: hypothetical protein D6791_15830 [Chloroflexota bacterium]